MIESKQGLREKSFQSAGAGLEDAAEEGQDALEKAENAMVEAIPESNLEGMLAKIQDRIKKKK